MKKVVVVLSGGMDSATTLYQAIKDGFDPYTISFNYGQRHKKELDYAKELCENISINHKVVDITNLTEVINKSALTNADIDVPEGHYAQENMKITVVPNRNMIMLSLATAWAESMGLKTVYYACHANDRAIYPDCRAEFVTALSQATQLGTYSQVKILAPYVNKLKADIVAIGHALGIDYQRTWSCYEGLEKHCGQCGTCQERKEAFQIAGVFDPTLYEV